MCDCFSYNMQTGNTPNVILDPNEYFELDNVVNSVCVDACISEQIKMLWENKIWTLGCCCGHGEKDPNVILDSSEDPDMAHKLLYKNDPKRDWKVLQWQLINTNSQ